MTYRSEAKHLRVVYYTRPCYFDAVLSMLPYLADRVKLHLIVELSPSQWMTSLFDVPRQDIPTGIITGESLMKPFFPPAALTPFKKLSTLNFIVHTQSRSIHPNTLVANNKAIVLIKKISPDIVHFDDLSLRIALSLWRLRRFRIVLSVHDPIHRSGEKNWRNTLSRKLAFRWISAFILHNNQQRQAFLARYPISNKNVRSIKLGTYNAYRYWSTSDLAQHSNVVLFFGRLSRYKGIATLLRAAKRVDEKIRNVEFILAGRSLPDYELPAIPKLPNGGSIRSDPGSTICSPAGCSRSTVSRARSSTMSRSMTPMSALQRSGQRKGGVARLPPSNMRLTASPAICSSL